MKLQLIATSIIVENLRAPRTYRVRLGAKF